MKDIARLASLALILQSGAAFVMPLGFAAVPACLHRSRASVSLRMSAASFGDDAGEAREQAKKRIRQLVARTKQGKGASDSERVRRPNCK